jgi:hypothetical protein
MAAGSKFAKSRDDEWRSMLTWELAERSGVLGEILRRMLPLGMMMKANAVESGSGGLGNRLGLRVGGVDRGVKRMPGVIWSRASEPRRVPQQVIYPRQSQEMAG